MTEAWTPANGDCAPDPSVAALGGPAPYWNSYEFTGTAGMTGNRTKETLHAVGGQTSRTYTYPAPGSNRPHAVTQVDENGPGGDKTYKYEYDQAGNTTCRPSGSTSNTCPQPGSGSQGLLWDAEGRLTSTTSSGQTSSYVYTADGERLIRREGGVTTVYLPGGQELRLTVSTGVKTAQRYYTFGQQTVAIRTGPGLAGVNTLIADHHGTAEISIANTTNTVTRRRHDPYGNVRPRGTTPTWPGDHGFLNKPKDANGLTHIGAREYDPLLGAFVSVDPVLNLADPQQLQWNAYAYGNNNPLTYSDPTGLINCKDCMGGGGGAGGGGPGSVKAFGALLVAMFQALVVAAGDKALDDDDDKTVRGNTGPYRTRGLGNGQYEYSDGSVRDESGKITYKLPDGERAKDPEGQLVLVLGLDRMYGGTTNSELASILWSEGLNAFTYNGEAYGNWEGEHPEGAPAWMNRVSDAIKNPNVRIVVTLDGLDGGNKPLDRLRLAAQRGGKIRATNVEGNGTNWEMAKLVNAIIMKDRDATSVTWYMDGSLLTSSQIGLPDNDDGWRAFKNS